jgi:hypothetical protein
MCEVGVIFQSQKFSHTVHTGYGHIPHPMKVTDFIAGMKLPVRRADQLHLVSGLRIREINLRFPVQLHGLIVYCK